MSNSVNCAHILVFPYPAQGHMLPLLDFTQQLALRGLTITILITPKNLPILSPLLSKYPSIQTLIFPFPDHPSLPPGVENVKDIGNHANCHIISALSALYHPITLWFNTHPSPPLAILSDFFLGWTQTLANHLRIPRITFYSVAPFLASVFNYLWPKLPTLKLHTLAEVSFPHLPYAHSFPCAHIPSILLRYKESDPDWEIVRDGMIANMSSWGSVFNTFDALDSDYLDHVRKETGQERVWAIGPLLNPVEDHGRIERGGPSSIPAKDVLTWLDNSPDDSVIYVCFGSQVTLSKHQMEALGAGLELSGARFIWAVKMAVLGQEADDYGVVPTGFEDRVAGRGLVIKGWAPQVSILSHRAVGSFLTHCGWNSVLEGIIAGVSLLAWPMEADQYVNAKLFAEDIGRGTAVVVCKGRDAIPDSVELARSISDSMGGTRPERVRVVELRDKALAAIKGGGSSMRDTDNFVKELFDLNIKREREREMNVN